MTAGERGKAKVELQSDPANALMVDEPVDFSVDAQGLLRAWIPVLCVSNQQVHLRSLLLTGEVGGKAFERVVRPNLPLCNTGQRPSMTIKWQSAAAFALGALLLGTLFGVILGGVFKAGGADQPPVESNTEQAVADQPPIGKGQSHQEKDPPETSTSSIQDQAKPHGESRSGTEVVERQPPTSGRTQSALVEIMNSWWGRESGNRRDLLERAAQSGFQFLRTVDPGTTARYVTNRTYGFSPAGDSPDAEWLGWIQGNSLLVLPIDAKLFEGGNGLYALSHLFDGLGDPPPRGNIRFRHAARPCELSLAQAGRYRLVHKGALSVVDKQGNPIAVQGSGATRDTGGAQPAPERDAAPASGGSEEVLKRLRELDERVRGLSGVPDQQRSFERTLAQVDQKVQALAVPTERGELVLAIELRDLAALLQRLEPYLSSILELLESPPPHRARPRPDGMRPAAPPPAVPAAPLPPPTAAPVARPEPPPAAPAVAAPVEAVLPPADAAPPPPPPPPLVAVPPAVLPAAPPAPAAAPPAIERREPDQSGVPGRQPERPAADGPAGESPEDFARRLQSLLVHLPPSSVPLRDGGLRPAVYLDRLIAHWEALNDLASGNRVTVALVHFQAPGSSDGAAVLQVREARTDGPGRARYDGGPLLTETYLFQLALRIQTDDRTLCALLVAPGAPLDKYRDGFARLTPGSRLSDSPSVITAVQRPAVLQPEPDLGKDVWRVVVPLQVELAANPLG